MPEPDFDRLREMLYDAGIAPRHTRRTVLELSEHYTDLKDDLIRNGMDGAQAETEASSQLGPLEEIASAVRARPELRCWAYRYPRIGRVVLPLAWAATLPVTPLVASIEYAPAIARWGAIVSLSAAITAAMFLILELSISLG